MVLPKPQRASEQFADPTSQPKSHLTRQQQPSHHIPRHRIPSNRIPTSTKWPPQSKRLTPKSGPTRSRTTSAQPVSRHPRMRRIVTCKRRRTGRAHTCGFWNFEENGYQWLGGEEMLREHWLTMASTIQTSGARPPTSVSPLRPSWTPRKTPKCTSN